MVERSELIRILELEGLGPVGINPAPARDRRQDEGAFHEGGAGTGCNVEVTCRIDHDIAENGLAPFLGFADNTLDGTVLNNCG